MYQHYIPQFILRNFSCDEGVYIWTYTRNDGVARKKIERIFGGRHITSLKSIDTTNRSSRSSTLKTFEQSIRKDTGIYERDIIGALETDAAPIIHRIIDLARREQLPQLNSKEANILKHFFLLSARRTPESQVRMRTTDNRDLAFDLMKQKADQDDVPFGDMDEMYRRIPSVRKINDIVMENTDARLAAGVLPNMGVEAEKFCRQVGLQVLYCGRTRRRFVIGSYGYAIVTRHLETKCDRVAFFPVSPEVAISLTDLPHEEYFDLASASEVRQINIASAELSHRIAGRTQDDLLDYQEHIGLDRESSR